MSKVAVVFIAVTAFVMIAAFGAAWVFFYITGGTTFDEYYGEVVSEERVMEDEFREVELNGFGSLEVTQGDEVELIVESNEELIAKISTEVKNGKLIIDEEVWTDKYYVTLDLFAYSIRPDTKYYLTVPDIDEIEQSGAGRIEIDKFESDNLKFILSGAGTFILGDIIADEVSVHLEGAGSMDVDYLEATSIEALLDGAGSYYIREGVVDSQTLELDGFGSYRAKGMDSKKAEVVISGAGNGEISVSEVLDVKIDGVGNLNYYGSPVVRQEVDGLGNVSGH